MDSGISSSIAIDNQLVTEVSSTEIRGGSDGGGWRSLECMNWRRDLTV